MCVYVYVEEMEVAICVCVYTAPCAWLFVWSLISCSHLPITCAGSLQLTFDNTFTRLWGKTIYYNLAATPAAGSADAAEADAAENEPTPAES